jgi:hypothetical protein
MLTLQGETQRVIMKRLPTVEVLEKEVTDAGLPCECTDQLFNNANPDCDYCNGTGMIKIDLPLETVEIRTGDKRVWLTNARIIVDAAEAIYDDEEDLVISDIHAFFEPDEEVQAGDFLIPEGSKQVFIIRSAQKVRSLDNVLLIDCALEEQSV